MSKQQFSTVVKNDYVHLKTWGELDKNNLDAPANAALALAKEKNITKLLDDIREVDTSNVSIPIQVKSMGIMWKLRTFDKVAIVLKDSRIRSLFAATLEVLHLNIESKFKSFDNEQEAIAWLQKSPQQKK